MNQTLVLTIVIKLKEALIMIINCYDLLKDDDGFPYLLLRKTESSRITKASEAVEFAIDHYNLRSQFEEYVILLALDSSMRVKGIFEISHGGFQQAFCGLKETFSRLLLVGASCFIVMHNHPSGRSKESDDDFRMFKRLEEASKMMDIKLLDFIIVGDDINSFADRGLLT